MNNIFLRAYPSVGNIGARNFFTLLGLFNKKNKDAIVFFTQRKNIVSVVKGKYDGKERRKKKLILPSLELITIKIVTTSPEQNETKNHSNLHRQIEYRISTEEIKEKKRKKKTRI